MTTMTKSKPNETIRKLSDREHIVHRPSMYIGSVSNEEHEVQVFTGEDLKFETKTLTYPPGLIKIINEVIDNSVDAIIKTKVGDSVSVKISPEKNEVHIEDNSAGFPLPTNAKGATAEDSPMVIALGNARAGSNFNDEENQGQMGTNGVGAFATNCFSTKFTCKSNRDNYEQVANWKDNAIFAGYNIQRKDVKSGTTVQFNPDLAKFNIDQINDDILEIVKTRLTVLALTYPSIKFYFNNKQIKTPSKLSKLFTNEDTPFVEFNTDAYSVIVIANNEKQPHFSVVNGLTTPDGGSHIDLIMQEISAALTSAKGLNCTRSDINNTLQIVFVGRGWKNLRFNSQTKEKITNSTKETREYLGDLDSLVSKVKSSKAIKDYIKATTAARELRTEKKALQAAKKTKIKSEKFLDAQGERNILMLVEGDSAMGGLVPALGRKGIAYYALKGKPLNAYKSTAQKVSANKELSELLAIIHQNDFKKIVIASDADADGAHITGLLIGFIVKYLPEYQDRLYRLRTPVKSAMRNGRIVRWVYGLEDELEIKQGETSYYLKGLGSWQAEELQKVVSSDGFDNIVQKVDLNNSKLSSILEAWLGDDSQIRKDMILKNDFSIAKI